MDISNKRRTRSPRFNVSNTLSFGTLQIVNHQRVLPGESLQKHSVNLRMQSVPVNNVLAGAYFDLMTFYVPYRILWSGWEDFMVEGTGTPPVASAGGKTMLCLTGEPEWPILALDHILEEYFRSPFIPSATTDRRMPHFDWLADQNLTDPANFPVSEKVSMDVQTGTPDFVELDMDELAEAEYRQRMRNKLQNYSSGYAQLLSDYGVRVTEGVVAAEYLGGSRSWHYPSRTIDESTGFSVQSYMFDAKFKRDRKNAYFSEHGILVDVAVLRPKVYPRNKSFNSEYLLTSNADYGLPVDQPMFRKDRDWET